MKMNPNPIHLNPVKLDSEFIESRNHKSDTLTRSYLIKDAVRQSLDGGGLPIYACDKKSKRKGAKYFYTGSYDAFYNHYLKLPVEGRCFYETILPQYPCHLYADVEGDVDINPDIHFPSLTDALLGELVDFMVEFFKKCKSHAFSKKDVEWVELDSSTPVKFSRHYIFKIRNGEYMLENNFHCGALMRHFQKHIVQKYGYPTIENNPNPYFFKHSTEKSEEDCMVFLLDMGVYTLRRQFRIVGSSKRKGKKRRELWVTGKEKKLTKSLVFDCLIQYIHPNTTLKVIKLTEPNGASPVSSSLRSFDKSGTPISIAVGASVRQPIDSKQNTLDKFVGKRKRDDSTTSGGGNGTTQVLPGSLQQRLKAYFTQNYQYTVHSYTLSTSGSGGSNRDLKIKLDTYDTRCMNKKSKTGVECHKTNHVYFIVYPGTLVHFQGCYDQTYCKNQITHLGRIQDTNLVSELKSFLKAYFQPQKTTEWLPIQ